MASDEELGGESTALVPVNRCRALLSNRTRRCHKLAIRGGTVCAKHGGSAPQVKRKAYERVLAELLPSIHALIRTRRKAEQNGDWMPAIAACKTLLALMPTLEADLPPQAESAGDYLRYMPQERLDVLAIWIAEAKAAQAAEDNSRDDAIDVEAELVEETDAQG